MLSRTNEIYKKLSNYNEKALKAITPPNNGMTHLEVFIKKDGEIIFLEIAARPTGGLTPLIYDKCFGVDIKKEHLKLNISPTYMPKLELSKYGFFISSPYKKGVVSKINIPEGLTSKYQIISNIEIGDNLSKNPSKISDVAVSILVFNDNPNDLYNDFYKFKEFEIYSVNLE